MGKRGKGRATRRNKQQNSAESEEIVRAPHTFVIKRGSVGKRIGGLLLDLRKVLQPFTASNLLCGRSNVLKDYLAVAGPLHVSHILSLTRSEFGQSFLRLIRLPSGPTLTFRIEDCDLMREVVSTLRKQAAHPKQYEAAPLLILNNFSAVNSSNNNDANTAADAAKNRMHFTMLRSMFQGMLPSIDINTVKLNSIKRCLLLNYDHSSGTIDWRHYNIKVVPSGVSRAVKKLMRGRVPQLGAQTDISEFVLEQGGLSESEAEDGLGIEANTAPQVLITQNLSARGVHENESGSIRLTELGPRMNLRLIKIEEKICTGEVLFHNDQYRTAEEIEVQRERIAELRRLKAARRSEQERNVERKRIEKEEHKARTLEGTRRKYGPSARSQQSENYAEEEQEADVENDADDEED